jgi:hypothetical protein
MPSRFEFELRDTGDLLRVTRALGRTKDGRQIRRNLASELRGMQAPLVRKVKLAWRSAPSRQSRRRGAGLRSELARVTRGEVRLTGREAGIRIRTDGRRMSAGRKSLPQYAEGTKRPWRHQVFGDDDTFVSQSPFPRFYAAVRPDQNQARRRVETAVRDVFLMIARS